MKMVNGWIMTFSKRVDEILKEMDIYRLRGSYGGNLNLGEIMNIISSARMEIINLNGENEILKQKINDLEDKMKESNS